MTQFQLDVICKIIDAGAPAIAEELCGALDILVRSYNAAVEENKQLKKDLEAATSMHSEEQADR